MIADNQIETGAIHTLNPSTPHPTLAFRSPNISAHHNKGLVLWQWALYAACVDYGSMTKMDVGNAL